VSASAPLTLISHELCPFVQRAAIVLLDKGVPYTRRDVDLSDKPAWFLNISPLGKTPLLLVGDSVVFESAVICEYLDETYQPRMHPEDPLKRALHRSWGEFGSQVLGTIYVIYTTPDETAMLRGVDRLREHLKMLEAQLGPGPFFGNDRLSIVDAVFAPIFRYVDAIGTAAGIDDLSTTPRVRAWRKALATHRSVEASAAPGFQDALLAHFRSHASALARRMV
jgi:glutathione S-transferase